MDEMQLLLLVMTLSCLGGAIGMRLAGGVFWKGLLLAAVLNVGMTAVSYFIDNILVSIIGGVIVMGLAARVMKIPARQSANVIIGVILFTVIPPLLLASYF
ncbi:MAG: hypothetical protein ACK5MQ_00130 [Pikeienuella sp.]